MKGFFNRVLKIDVGEKSFSVQGISDHELEYGLGGKGIATRLLLDNNPPKVEPFSQDNHLIFAVGPVTDSPIHGSCRIRYFQSKIYNLLEEYWVIFLNQYADGSKECGVLLGGVDQFKAGYYNQDGKARVTTPNKMKITRSPPGFIQEATFLMDESAFRYTTEAAIIRLPDMKTEWTSGQVVNLNDPRKPVKSFAWFEYFFKKK